MSVKFIFVCMMVFVLVGCGTSPYQQTVDDYMRVYPKNSLGMSKEDVVKILSPSQQKLSNTDIKQPDMYKKNGVNVEILYFRSGWNSDGLTTDDEFTPYIFNDGKLVAVGWHTLGGTKSQGQARSNNTNTTIIYPRVYVVKTFWTISGLI
jgi:hypothetical protein